MQPIANDLESIRRHIRDVCASDQAQWAASWKTLFTDPETARRGLVSPIQFIETLALNRVVLSRNSTRALVTHFAATSSGCVHIPAFLRWVALSQPADHVDPERVFARLPQPYRRIVKVLERDVLDAAWTQITQQSNRFKAESAAATARLVGTAISDNNDIDTALQRCCKRFATYDVGDRAHVRGVAQHDTLPLLLVAFETLGADDSIHVVLQLLHLPSRAVVAECLLPVAASGSSDDSGSSSLPDVSMTRAECEAVSVASIASRAAAHGDTALVCVVQLTVLTTTTVSSHDDVEEQPAISTLKRTATFVFVYQVIGVGSLLAGEGDSSDAAPINEQTAAFERIATGAFDRRIAWLALSPDAQFLALPTAAGVVSVFRLPTGSHCDSGDHTVVDTVDSASTVPTSVPLDCSATPSTAFMTIKVNDNDATASTHVHFVVAPLQTVGAVEPRATYAIVVCDHTTVRKLVLQRFNGATQPTPTVTWRHVAAITASALDATTRLLLVGLADGSVVVWDTLEEVDYLHLAAPTPTTLTTPQPNSTGVSITSVAMYGNEYVVTFSAASQHVCVYDVRRRVAPQLMRVMTPQVPSSNSERKSIVGIALAAAGLDVPVALLAYANGKHVLLDLRTATAIGSLRSRVSPVSIAPLLSPYGVVITQTTALALYDWPPLIDASFPGLEVDGSTADAATAKRLLLSMNAPPLLTLTLADVTADAVNRLLRRSAGKSLGAARSYPSSSQSSTDLLLPTDEHQASRTGATLAASSSSLSVASRVSATHESVLPPELPPLEDVALQPSITSARERFCQFRIELDASATRDKDAKLHRRRAELLTALTTGAW